MLERDSLLETGWEPISENKRKRNFCDVEIRIYVLTKLLSETFCSFSVPLNTDDGKTEIKI